MVLWRMRMTFQYLERKSDLPQNLDVMPSTSMFASGNDTLSCHHGFEGASQTKTRMMLDKDDAFPLMGGKTLPTNHSRSDEFLTEVKISPSSNKCSWKILFVEYDERLHFLGKPLGILEVNVVPLSSFLWDYDCNLLKLKNQVVANTLVKTTLTWNQTNWWLLTFKHPGKSQTVTASIFLETCNPILVSYRITSAKTSPCLVVLLGSLYEAFQDLIQAFRTMKRFHAIRFGCFFWPRSWIGVGVSNRDVFTKMYGPPRFADWWAVFRTLSETNSKRTLKTDGWKTTNYFPFQKPYFQGRTVSFREGI